MRSKIYYISIVIVILMTATATVIGLYKHSKEEERIASFHRALDENFYEYQASIGEIIVPIKDLSIEETIEYYKTYDFELEFKRVEDSIDHLMQIGTSYEVVDIVPPYQRVIELVDLLSIVNDSKQLTTSKIVDGEIAELIIEYQRYALIVIAQMESVKKDLENPKVYWEGPIDASWVFNTMSAEDNYERLCERAQLTLSNPLLSDQDRQWIKEFIDTYNWYSIKDQYKHKDGQREI